jgi:D-aspartate ligase
MITTVCVLGDHIQSLGIVRTAGRLGYGVILMNDDKICISRFSKYCSRFIPFRTEDHLLSQLLKLPNNGVLIMPTNDRLVKFVIDHYDVLISKFVLSTPDAKALEVCYNKKLTYQKALELNIPIPDSHFPETYEHLCRISETLSYPVIIKPAVMHRLYEKKGKKAYVCRNKAELLKNYIEATTIIDPSEIIVQKFIAGMARNLYSYCSFFADGKIYGGFCANRIRQKPMDFGIATTFAISVVNEQLCDNALSFLRGIDYFGLSEVEFMYDPDDGVYKLIEVNPRTWKWHSIANKLNINLIRMMIEYLNGNKTTIQVNRESNVGWIETVTDTYVVLGEILRGRMSLSHYLKSLKVKKEFACFDFHDPMPTISYIVLLPYLFFSR